jgi:hypothetical protein
MVKLVRRIVVFVLFLGLTATSLLAATTNGSPDDPPTIGPAPDTEPPNLTDLFALFERFDTLYSDRQRLGSAAAEDWIALTARLAEHTGADISLHPDEGGQFAVRAALVKGESHLFASIDLFIKNDPKFVEQYKLGIEHLIWVLRATEGRRLSDPRINMLPDYSAMAHPRIANAIHPRSGYETIGTGFDGLLRDERNRANPVTIKRRMSAMVGEYSTLLAYQEALAQSRQTMRSIRQIGTSEIARELLAELCPWGVEVYMRLSDVGLADNIDFRILAPYWGKDPSMVEQFVEAVSTEASALYHSWFSADGETVSHDVQPLVSSISLDEAIVPDRIRQAMRRIVGSSAGTGDHRGHSNIEGVLGTLNTRPIHWRWVGEPTYNIWYVSPAVFDWQPSDYMWLWFTAVKVYFGGAGGVLADEFINKFGEYISTNYGEGPVNVPALTNVIIEQYDKGIFMPSVIEEGKWLSPAAIARKVGTPVLGAIEQQTREGLFQGIDMEKHSLGIAYDGNDIPAILIRGDVLGYPEVAEDEYPKTLNAVRFFLAYPEFPGTREPLQKYDLSQQPPPILTFDSLGWWLLPDPLGSIDIVNSFAPPRQELVFRLTEHSAQSVKSSDNLKADLWTVASRTEHKYASAKIDEGNGEFRIILHNTNDPNAVQHYLNLHPQIRGNEINFAELEAIKGRFHAVVAPKTQYVLRISADGKPLVEHPIILDRGRERQRTITGRLTSLDDGAVKLEFEPEIEILKLEVSEPEVVPASGEE